MEQLIESIIAIIIVLFGFHILLFAVGASKIHPIKMVGEVTGRILAEILRLPIVLFGGIATGLFQRKGRKRRRLK